MLLEKLKKLSSAIESKDVSQHILIGLEKESLRIAANGLLASTNHPKNLGAALTNPSITTDYAESQLELITKPYNKLENLLNELTDLHTFCLSNLQPKELLWPYSLPGILPNEKEINTAKYGNSASAQLKEIYRVGLGYRYGKTMQLICGIHFNFSFNKEFWTSYFPTIKNQQMWDQSDVDTQYMHIIRNYMRLSWLPVYLFGASPAIHSKAINPDIATANYLKLTHPSHYIAPYGTSLRESNLGYKNKNSTGTTISYNSLKEYINTLETAVNTEDRKFKEIGMFRYDKQIQLNCNLLQLASEYYGTVRPKPNIHIKNLQSYKALNKSGIAYIELRNLDINPFAPIGIELNKCLIMELMMYYCCLTDSPQFTPQERAIISSNIEKTALLGRQPNLQLKHEDKNISLKEWALNIFAELKAIAQYLDKTNRCERYSTAVSYYETLINDPDKTISAKIVNELHQNNESYTDYFLKQAVKNAAYFKTHELTSEKINFYKELARKTLAQAKEEELNDVKNNITLAKLLLNY